MKATIEINGKRVTVEGTQQEVRDFVDYYTSPQFTWSFTENGIRWGTL